MMQFSRLSQIRDSEDRVQGLFIGAWGMCNAVPINKNLFEKMVYHVILIIRLFFLKSGGLTRLIIKNNKLIFILKIIFLSTGQAESIDKVIAATTQLSAFKQRVSCKEE